MDKIFLHAMLAQASIDIVFSSYRKHPNFKMTPNDILRFCDHFDMVLQNLESVLLETNLQSSRDLYPEVV